MLFLRKDFKNCHFLTKNLDFTRKRLKLFSKKLVGGDNSAFLAGGGGSLVNKGWPGGG